MYVCVLYVYIYFPTISLYHYVGLWFVALASRLARQRVSGWWPSPRTGTILLVQDFATIHSIMNYSVDISSHLSWHWWIATFSKETLAWRFPNNVVQHVTSQAKPPRGQDVLWGDWNRGNAWKKTGEFQGGVAVYCHSWVSFLWI